ncbi:unnamed protein product, partial [Brachionus calyciflorus]
MGNQNQRLQNYSSNKQFEDISLIIQPYLYLGGGSINRNPQLANFYGITHILNMASEIAPNMDLFGNRNIKYKHIPADDTLNYNIRYHFEEAFELIDDARRTNGKILVHCAMGISRSATIVIAYIMNRYDMTLRSALDFVRSKRPIVQPNSLFLKLLLDYEKELIAIYKDMEKKTQLRNKTRNIKYLTIEPNFAQAQPQMNLIPINLSGSHNKSTRNRKCPESLKLTNITKIDLIVYADDIILISTTKLGLQQQIIILEEFGIFNEIKYNPNRTVFIVFNKNVDEIRRDNWQEDIYLDGSKLTQVTSMKYLGVNISDDDKNTEHISKRKKASYCALAK